MTKPQMIFVDSEPTHVLFRTSDASSLYAAVYHGLAEPHYIPPQDYIRFPKSPASVGGYVNPADRSRVVTITHEDGYDPVTQFVKRPLLSGNLHVFGDATYWMTSTWLADVAGRDEQITISGVAATNTAPAVAADFEVYTSDNSFNAAYSVEYGVIGTQMIIALSSTGDPGLHVLNLGALGSDGSRIVTPPAGCGVRSLGVVGGQFYYQQTCSGSASALYRLEKDLATTTKVLDVAGYIAAVRGDRIYFFPPAASTEMHTEKMDGSDPRTLAIPSGALPYDYDEDNAYLASTPPPHTTNMGTLYRLPASGGPIVTLTSGRNFADGHPFVDSEYVYWDEMVASVSDPTLAGSTWAVMRMSKGAPGVP